MLKEFFTATKDEEENSILRKLVMGLMLGAAIGWVLLRYRRQEAVNGSWTTHPGEGDGGEIEITDAVLAESEPDEPELEMPDDAPTGSKLKGSAKGDKLEAIKGIGPVFARRLKAAGIQTFQDLAETPPEKLREIVSAQPWQAVEADEWIAQARALS